ncbi:hypothetical protein ILUMI_01622 [Ignelater luminosus]|uniref:Peptidase A2 domain-containing protein n=1 Tax=Ignelater luminosus TaxID=2038154 RepID=A0A8K0DJT2_IGNLU|nr:hypothetical protein ILUMI_01622 [Ignelater luminosus]
MIQNPGLQVDVTKKKEKTADRRQETKKQVKKTEKYCSKCNRKHDVKACPAYGQQCLFCQGRNHFAVVCKKRLANSTTQVGNSKFSNKPVNSKTYNVKEIVTNEDSEEFFISEIQSKSNRFVKFKLDTGAEVNVISINLLNALQLSDKLNKSDDVLVSFDNYKINALRKILFLLDATSLAINQTKTFMIRLVVFGSPSDEFRNSPNVEKNGKSAIFRDIRSDDGSTSGTNPTLSKLINKRKRIPQESASFTLMKYIPSKNVNQGSAPPATHPVDAFLNGIAPTFKTLNPYFLNLPKSEIFTIVQKYEMHMFMQQQPQEAFSLSQEPMPPSFACTSSGSSPSPNDHHLTLSSASREQQITAQYLSSCTRSVENPTAQDYFQSFNEC